MFNFDIKKTAICHAVRWEKYPVFKFARILKDLFLILFIIFFTLFLYGIFLNKISSILSFRFLSLSIIFLAFFVFFWYIESFFNLKLKRPKLETSIAKALSRLEDYNLAELLSFEPAKGVWRAFRFCHSKKIMEVSSSILFYFLLSDSPKLRFIFSRALLDLEEIKNILKDKLNELSPQKNVSIARYSLDFQDTIIKALKIAQKKEHQRIEIGDLITALAKHNSIFQKLLTDFNLKLEDIENLTQWVEYLEEKIEERKKFWEYENLLRKGTLAKEWTAGYTITLDKFSIDLTDQIRINLPDIIGHKEQIEMVERALSGRNINNVLLVGEPGTGRKSIVSALAKKSLLGKSLPEVNYKRVVELDLPQLISQLPNLEQVEATLDTIFQEVVLAGNVILVINDFHNYISQTLRPGVVDISGVIISYLHLPQFQVVAITTYSGLHQYIEQNPSLLSLFEKVEVLEISERETLLLLENLTLSLERTYKRFVSYPALREIISLSEKYMPSLPFPEKAMELLNEAVIYVAAHTRDAVVLPSHVAKIITEKTQIPVGEIEKKEKQILLNLEKLIHERIINQEEAVKEVATALRRARSEVTVRKGPMGCFLFLGPTGVGKTETSKALAEFYFGSEKRMIRLDMSEFQTVLDIKRLLGAPGEEGLLTTPVRENPFSLVLLDEFEKAHPNILNLFLQVLDEGHLTDGQGRKVDFKSSMIIATSNAAYQIILQVLQEKTDWSQVKQKLLDFIFAEGIFRPELVNRFDGVVVFKPLSKKNLLEIAELLMRNLKTNLEEKGVELIITKELKEKIVELSYSPVFGAREMRRVIQDKIENALATSLLSGELKRGSRVKINPNDFSLIINP